MKIHQEQTKMINEIAKEIYLKKKKKINKNPTLYVLYHQALSLFIFDMHLQLVEIYQIAK